MRRKAPWPDFKGNDIYEGDIIEHPDGERGIVTVVPADAGKGINYEWKSVYDDGYVLWLGSQIDDKGMAVVVPNVDDKRNLSQKMRDAGYTPRDTRLECEDCGVLVSRQWLSNGWHKCSSLKS